MNLVETGRQKKQLEKGLVAAAPLLGVFAQRLATDLFNICSLEIKQAAREKLGISSSGFHLIYAGRFIPNKGLVQIIRALDLWPVAGTCLTMIGDYEAGFPISQSGGDCSVFGSYFHREGIARAMNLVVQSKPPLPQSGLVEWFRRADAFVYPSFHEDEASGNAAHEAVLSGLPAVVTDWYGLGQLGRNTRGGALPTYATLGGVRYSLHSLREQIAGLPVKPGRQAAEADSQWVKSAFDPNWMRTSVENSVATLLSRDVEPPPEGGWRCPSRLERLAHVGPPTFREAIAYGSDSDPDGLYVDGLGYRQNGYSEARFLSAIQGLYTTYPKPPELRPGAVLHGFWRVALWEHERALVEFDFPGPRLLRFDAAEWPTVVAAASPLSGDEIEFTIPDEASSRILQRAVDLGYLVPHDLGTCRFRTDEDFPPSEQSAPTSG